MMQSLLYLNLKVLYFDSLHRMHCSQPWRFTIFNLPIYYLTAQYHNALNTTFEKLLPRSGRTSGRAGQRFRGCVPRGCRLSWLQGSGSCTWLLEGDGWQAGESREVCGAWRILALQIQNVWNTVWVQPDPPGMPACRCLALLVVHLHLPSSYVGCRGRDVCWRTSPRPGGLLAASSVPCSVLSTRGILSS